MVSAATIFSEQLWLKVLISRAARAIIPIFLNSNSSKIFFPNCGNSNKILFSAMVANPYLSSSSSDSINRGNCFACLRSINRGSSFTCLRSINHGNCFTCLRSINHGNCFTCLRSIIHGNCFTCLRSINHGNCFTCLRRINRGSCFIRLRNIMRSNCFTRLRNIIYDTRKIVRGGGC